MSMELMVKAMKAKVGNPLRKLVLIKLADNANDLGECWPSYQHIADQCEISRRSVINHIKALEDSGLLVKQYRNGTHKANSSNVYTLNLDGAAPAPSESPALPPSAAPAPDGESPAPPPSAGAAPRTSHSFEPVTKEQEQQKTDLPFSMNLGWQPDPAQLKPRAVISGLKTEQFTPEVIGEFKIHYEATDRTSTDAQWTATLISWVKRRNTWAAKPNANNQNHHTPSTPNLDWAKDLDAYE